MKFSQSRRIPTNPTHYKLRLHLLKWATHLNRWPASPWIHRQTQQKLTHDSDCQHNWRRTGRPDTSDMVSQWNASIWQWRLDDVVFDILMYVVEGNCLKSSDWTLEKRTRMSVPHAHTHTRTGTYKRTLARTQIHMHTYSQILSLPHTQTHTHTQEWTENSRIPRGS